MQTGNSEWQICAQTHDRLGESILWHPVEQALYWIDFYGPVVHRKNWARDQVESWKIKVGQTVGSLVLAEHGRLVLAIDHGLHLLDTKNGTTRFFADPKNGKIELAYNDGKVDRAGRYWVGTYDIAESDPSGIFYRVGADGMAKVADQGFMICNGPTFSPDNRTLYFSDTVGRRLLAYDLGLDGEITGRRVFFTISNDDGMPDGLAADSDGNVWCALYGGGRILCIDARGTLKKSLDVPATFVTSLCFGGPDLKTLFVTTGWHHGTTDATKTSDIGGAVFMRPVDRPGLPEPIFPL